MKRSKNLSACNDLLKELQAFNEKKPEASSKLARARKKLNQLNRSGANSHEDVFEAIREIAEAVLKSIDGK
jgi:predicted  nucleic acid-binding Zn-ribbon protein